jgi:hypothetical protein
VLTAPPACPCCSPVPVDGAAHMPHAHADAGFPYDGHVAATIGSPVPTSATRAEETVTLSALLRQFRLRLEDRPPTLVSGSLCLGAP